MYTHGSSYHYTRKRSLFIKDKLNPLIITSLMVHFSREKKQVPTTNFEVLFFVQM